MLTIPKHDMNEDRLDQIFDALSSHKRRGILHELSLRPATVSQLAHQQSMSLPAIHKHMNTLEDSRLVIRRKAGRTNFVALNTSTLATAQQWLNQYHTAWNNAQATLENYIASMQE